jgi:hypothetical protein
MSLMMGFARLTPRAWWAVQMSSGCLDDALSLMTRPAQDRLSA